MHAIEISRPGPPDVLQLVDRPRPTISANDVLIRVVAAGVNRPDVMQRMGHYPPPAGASDIPGLEVAGTVDEVGAAVTAFVPGDRVCALVSGGGYAEWCAAPEGQCLPLPQGSDFIGAAALPETTFTVWSNVFDRGKLVSGETLLVHGGSSGIGTTAIQLAHARGARVLATAGSAEKCAACEALGADRAFNYRETDFVAAVKEATGGRGVDVVLDIVGGDYLQRNIAVLAMDGRLVQIGMLGGTKSSIDTLPILQRRLILTGSTLRPRPVAEKAAIARSVREHVWPLVEGGQLRALVHATYPLADAAEAHRMMESSEHIGKLVLLVQS
jgi:NADPH2:quinone reductase